MIVVLRAVTADTGIPVTVPTFFLFHLATTSASAFIAGKCISVTGVRVDVFPSVTGDGISSGGRPSVAVLLLSFHRLRLLRQSKLIFAFHRNTLILKGMSSLNGSS